MTAPAAKKPGAAASTRARKTRPAEEMYTPVNILRSDGVFWETAQVLESFSEPLAELDPDARRWTTTLGKALKIAFAWPPDENYYVVLPESYTLRSRQPKNRKSTSDRERRETFLFGHPAGYNDSCLYRSPAEFTPHMLWLMSESNDPSLCNCKVCSRTAGPPRQAEPQRYTPAAQPAPAPAATAAAAAASGGPVDGAVPAPARPAAEQARASAPAAAAGDTQQWADPASMFREGEMVWFKEAAWRIGVVALIDRGSGGGGPGGGGDDGRFKYLIAQLGHSMFDLPSSVKTREDMRPFLTYSVPQSTVERLTGKSFADVDWPAFAAEWAGADAKKRAVLQLEASKMAARAIDRSYSPFNRLLPPPPAAAAAAAPPGRQRYGGVFLGAEQIRLGDPVRVRTGPGLVMEVHDIYEDRAGGAAGPPALGFAGTTYRLTSSTGGAAAAAAPAGPQPASPAMRLEVDFRNRVQQAAGVRWAWRAEGAEAGAGAAGAASLGEADVAGRFYVTAQLMQIVDPDEFRAALDRGEIREAVKYLNNRMHGTGEYVGRRPDRRTTIGEAVSAQARAQLTMGEGVVEES